MSMIGNYRRISETVLKELLSHPDRLSDLLYPEDEDPDAPDDPDAIEDRLDIDKSWHLIHFLLNGNTWEGDWPLVGAVMGGTEVSEEDVGYGPARYLMPNEVAEVSRALSAISADELWSRFDSDSVRNAKIYPEGWQGHSADRDYVIENYNNLRNFFATAAEKQQVVLLYLN